MDDAMLFATELKVGTLNMWGVAGDRIELMLFAASRVRGLGYKEDVQEAMKSFCNGKTFTMPWP